MTGRQITWLAKTALPFFLLMMFAVWLVWLAPDLVNWLPRQMIG